LIIAVAIVSVAWYQLNASGAWDVATASFFNDTTVTTLDRVAWMAFLFALVFAAVSVTSANNTDSTTTTSNNMKKPSTATSSKKTIPTSVLQGMAQLSNDKEKFQYLYPHLRDDILQYLQTHHELSKEALDYCARFMNYNVPGGKLNRGLTVVAVLRTLQPPSSSAALSNTQVAQACILGWALEVLQAFFLVADDVMDASETRRGQPCWYQQPDVQLIAINDAFLLESFVFTLVREYFGHEPYVHDLIDLFLTVIQKTEVGQLLDLTSQPLHAKTVDLTRFTLDRYRQIVKYKTAYYSFYLPVAIGMILSGTTNPQAFQLAESICMIMGEYFQIQDDVLDCYGDPAVIGKIGTDIQDKKCSWLVVQALAKCSPAQRVILEQNYGQWDDQKVKAVKQVYEELNLQQLFQEYEEASYQAICAEIVEGEKLVPREVFDSLLQKIYKRSK
jgi:farnesyl diphosphate synthase